MLCGQEIRYFGVSAGFSRLAATGALIGSEKLVEVGEYDE